MEFCSWYNFLSWSKLLILTFSFISCSLMKNLLNLPTKYWKVTWKTKHREGIIHLGKWQECSQQGVSMLCHICTERIMNSVSYKYSKDYQCCNIPGQQGLWMPCHTSAARIMNAVSFQYSKDYECFVIPVQQGLWMLCHTSTARIINVVTYQYS